MKIKQYSNVFAEAKQHPKFEQYCEEHLARILLAKEIHQARLNNNLSMKELADKASTTPAVISRIENAQVSTGIDLIYRIFKSLGKDKIELRFN